MLISFAWRLLHIVAVGVVAIGLAILAPVWLWLVAVGLTVALQYVFHGCPITKLREKWDGRQLEQAKIGRLYERCRWQAAVLSAGSLLLTGCGAKQLAVALPYWPSLWRSALVFVLAWAWFAAMGGLLICCNEDACGGCCLFTGVAAAWCAVWQYGESQKPNCPSSQYVEFCTGQNDHDKSVEHQPAYQPNSPPPTYGR